MPASIHARCYFQHLYRSKKILSAILNSRSWEISFNQAQMTILLELNLTFHFAVPKGTYPTLEDNYFLNSLSSSPSFSNNPTLSQEKN